MIKKNIIFYIGICILLFNSCTKEQLSSCSTNKRLADCLDFYCGNVVDLDRMDSIPEYASIVTEQFNSVTAENIMKPNALHPTRNVFDWEEADQLASFCQASNKRLHGHTLIWHKQLPPWMYAFQGTKSEWEEMMRDHIFRIVDHFKGKVTSWDVINEAFEEDGTMRNTIWLKNIGPSYIEKAFQYAHEADPDAILFYNDYNIVLNPIKRKAILDLCIQLKAKGVPIHGIGIQMHIFNGFPENNDISKAMDEIWNQDFIIHISELDVSINVNGTEMPVAPEKDLDIQAEKYLYIFKAYDRIPNAYKFGITIWGVGDRDTWIRYSSNRDDYPLLFDDEYQPKKAFCTLISEL